MPSDPDFYHLRADGIDVMLDLAIGHLRSVVVTREGRRIAPLHTAPWLEEPHDPDWPPHLGRLSGDFLCAPFAASDIEAAPLHGWPANAPWTPLGTERRGDATIGRFELETRVLGARIVKELILRDDHPFLYQRHVFHGGAGDIPVAHHLMAHLPTGAALSFSPKHFAETPAVGLESDPARGRSVLAYPARFADLTSAPRADGGTADLTRYPFDSEHEDFVLLVEEAGNLLGWAAALRTQEQDLVLSLKSPRDLPATALWISNGGRFYPPWNRRHHGVLGIEEARAYGIAGHRASIADNPLTAAGVATALTLVPEGSVAIRAVIGLLPVPENAGEVVDVATGKDVLTVHLSHAPLITVPFDTLFLHGDA